MFLGVFWMIGKFNFLNSMVFNCLGEFRLNFFLVMLCVFFLSFIICLVRCWFCKCSMFVLINVLVCFIFDSMGVSGILMFVNIDCRFFLVFSMGYKCWCNFNVMLVFLVVYFVVIFSFI